MLPSRWWPVLGLFRVKFTVEDEPGYSVLAEVPVTVSADDVPTVAEPEPVPPELK
jgi:hypothetical protein